MNRAHIVSVFLSAFLAAASLPAAAAPPHAGKAATPQPISKVVRARAMPARLPGERTPLVKAAGVCSVPAPAVAVAPDPIAGLPTTRSTSGLTPFTIQNVGTGNLVVGALVGQDAGSYPCECGNLFSVVDSNACIGRVIPPGGSCVAFAQFSADNQLPEGFVADGTIEIYSNDPSNPILPVPITGTIGSAALSVATRALDFGGTPFAPVVPVLASLGVTNAGTLPLNVTGATIFGGVFSLAAGGTCPAVPFVLGVGSSCDFSIQFAPSFLGVQGATLYLDFNDGGTLFDGETVSLRGAGIATGGAFAFDPPSASFSVYRGQLSDVRSIIATNVDAVPHTVSDVIVGSPFWVNGDNCTLAGPIAPGGTCEIFVYADGALASPGNSTGDVSFTSTAGLAMVPLSVDISPNLAWNPSSQSFPDTPVGGPPTTRTYTLENRDGDPYNISIAIEPYSAPAYSLTGGTCLGGSIPASPDGIVPGTCTLDVQFLPSAGGFQYLYFYAQEQATPQRNYGYGDAFAVSPGPRLSLSPSSLVFPQGARGVPTQLPVSVTNLGDAPTSAAISLASNGAELSFDPGTCATAIPPGGSCVFNVTYLRTANTVGFANIDFVTVQFGALSEYLDVYGTTLDAIPATVEALPAGTSVFPATLVNTDSAPIEFSLANGGTDGSTLAITSIVSSSPEFLVASDCPLGPSTLSSQACCLATVTFHPTAVGTRTGMLTITTTAGVLVIGLTGEGLLSTPVLTLLPQPPGPLDFGSVAVGSPSSPQVVTVSNTGTGPLTFLGAPALAGDSSKASTAAKSFVIAGDFSQLATTCGASLPPPPDPLSECTTTLVFTPTATGARNGTFTVASDGGIAVLDLTGQGTALPVPDISLSASGLFFPGQTVGTTSLPQPVTVSNAGTAPLVISGVSASGDFAAASDCTALSPLAPLATCGITVTFTPLAPGVRTGSVAIASNDPDTPTATVALEGDGVASPSPNATITPATLSFPSTASRQVSAPLTATLSNTGAAPLAILAIEVVGSGFTASHTCGPSLAMGASCTITAIFAPPSAGSFAADVRIMTNSPAGAAFLRLTGSATAAPVGRLAAIPSTLSFGDQIVGTTSAARPFTVTNVGSAVASVSRITTTGDFTVSGSCADVRPGESCAFLASFSPTVVGTRAGQVLFEVDGATAPFAVALSGNGVPVPAPRVQLSASSLAFGNGLAGVGSTLFVTVTNAGSADLVFGPLMEAAGDFRVTANGCTGTLAPSQSCRIDVGFLPSIPGARSGELRFSTNAEGSPHRVALFGNGCRFEVTGRSSALVCGR